MYERLLNLETNTFRLNVVKSDILVEQSTAKLEGGVLTVAVPIDVDLAKRNIFTSKALPNIIEHFLKLEGERKLHKRLKELSEITGLNYRGSKVFLSRKTTEGRLYKSRQLTFGAYYKNSGMIKMNAFLMLMADECIDEVLIHELCHSVHPNHSREFYRLLEEKCPRYEEMVVKRKEIVKLVFDYFR